jgi:tyrosyl-tRNA synthetase
MTDQKFKSLLKRGVAEVITEAELLKLLKSGRILNLKQGFDPSAPDIHLGHVVGLRKLRQFQELGHKVTLIVGDWTARIGDPSGQSATRPMLSPSEIEDNARTYMEQFFKVVDKDKTELRWQSEWFSRFTLDEVIKLTSKFTIAQLLAREDFNKRYSSGNPISLAEMLYPLLQGYDSLAIKADVEFGGTDQKFNCLVGRELQQSTGQPPQQVFLVPLLIGTDGKQKMSKSLKNDIGIAEPPSEMYGKLMSIQDSLILSYFELVTDVSEEEVAEFRYRLDTERVNPMRLKKRLACEIVAQFHGPKAAQQAEVRFEREVQKGEEPEEIREVRIPFARLWAKGAAIRPAPNTEREDLAKSWIVGRDSVTDSPSSLLVKMGVAKSRSEAKRLIKQRAVELDGEIVTEKDMLVSIRDGTIIKVGKRRFVKIVDADKETA